ncbi:hypothetical protein JHK82_032672 [Glycine max]|uniref:Uncharacterized protein n=1 Tax=Glycine max TaxID=3847 RepID=K7LST7_SOYBN|nr:hypothetical protein JHK85_033380 [Glycine max]KAG4985072.1 hypothetical protein JHK86_032763 [Glycine max]KAG5118252.1 hypothetical protein JHK82_032672 [Glycine max]KAG5139236.1 hypothetical protein JHK84_033004 [Glycine max]KAH1141369.1 hypothetical protein GYH30_032555 [Glycine max]
MINMIFQCAIADESDAVKRLCMLSEFIMLRRFLDNIQALVRTVKLNQLGIEGSIEFVDAYGSNMHVSMGN